MTPAIRAASAADLAQLEALAAGTPGLAAGLAVAVAEGRAVVAEGGQADLGGLAGAAVDLGSGAVWLWAAAGAGRAALLQALLAAQARQTAAREPVEPSRASLHVRTDDAAFVERVARQTIPRLGRSGGSVIALARDGWVPLFDDLCDRDRRAHARLAEELSVRHGDVVVALSVEEGVLVRLLVYERGRMVDEYLSVPEWHGPLPPGEVVALEINPVLVARLTGADASALRAVARTAATPDELPPAADLAAELGSLLGLHGAALGHAAAVALPGATGLEH